MSKKQKQHQSMPEMGQGYYGGQEGAFAQAPQGPQGGPDHQGGCGGGHRAGAGMAYGAPAMPSVPPQTPNLSGTHQWLSSLPLSLRGANSTQFLLGAAIGGALAWTLSDQERRHKILKSAVNLYSNVAGGFEELKEQVSDIRAEAEFDSQEE